MEARGAPLPLLTTAPHEALARSARRRARPALGNLAGGIPRAGRHGDDDMGMVAAMKDFQSTTSVEAIGDAFAVVRVEQWRADNPMAIATIVRNKIMADGPFGTRAEADAALARLDARLGPAAVIDQSHHP
jgi:hypothetical protein